MKNRYRYLKNCLYPQVFTRHSYIVQCEWTLLIFQPPLIDNEWLSQHTHGKIGFVSKLYCKQKWKHPSDSDCQWHAYIFSLTVDVYRNFNVVSHACSICCKGHLPNIFHCEKAPDCTHGNENLPSQKKIIVTFPWQIIHIRISIFAHSQT